MKVNFFSLHIGDFLGGTIGMDATELGAYMSLLIAHYQAGEEGVPDDDIYLSRAARVGSKMWSKIKPRVMAKFDLKDGKYTSARVVQELLQMHHLSSQRKSNALKRWNSDDAKAEHKQSYPITTNQKPVKEENKPLTPLPAEQPPDAAPSDPVSFSKTATRETPWFEGKVITWTAGEYDDAMRDFGMTQAQIDEYLQGRDVWYTKQPERVQLGWKLSTIRDFSNQYGRRKR